MSKIQEDFFRGLREGVDYLREEIWFQGGSKGKGKTYFSLQYSFQEGPSAGMPVMDARNDQFAGDESTARAQLVRLLSGLANKNPDSGKITWELWQGTFRVRDKERLVARGVH